MLRTRLTNICEASPSIKLGRQCEIEEEKSSKKYFVVRVNSKISKKEEIDSVFFLCVAVLFSSVNLCASMIQKYQNSLANAKKGKSSSDDENIAQSPTHILTHSRPDQAVVVVVVHKNRAEPLK